jgi:hypothetical protein
MNYFMEPNQARWKGILDSNEGNNQFLKNASDQHLGFHFRIEFLMALTALFIWFRFILML